MNRCPNRKGSGTYNSTANFLSHSLQNTNF
jgi:hypothetical protein